jgi:hypothetical protein
VLSISGDRRYNAREKKKNDRVWVVVEWMKVLGDGGKGQGGIVYSNSMTRMI